MTIFGTPQEMIDEERNYLESLKEIKVKKECLHNFQMVYYGELDYECSKCLKSIWDLYTIEDARIVLKILKL
jgi:hypothetical protein